MKPEQESNGPAAPGPLFRKLRSFTDQIDQVSYWMVVVAMGIMAGLVVIQVVFRYLFSSGIDWSEEVARLAFVWAMFLAIPHGIRRGVHVGIDALVIRFSDRLQGILFRLSSVLAAGLMAVVFWYALEVTIYTWPEMMPTVNITAAVYYIAVLVAAIHSLIHLVLLAWGGRYTWN